MYTKLEKIMMSLPYMICNFLEVPENERPSGVHQSKPSLAII